MVCTGANWIALLFDHPFIVGSLRIRNIVLGTRQWLDLDRAGTLGTPRLSVSMRDAPTLVPRLDDVAVVGDPVEQRGGHLFRESRSRRESQHGIVLQYALSAAHHHLPGPARRVARPAHQSLAAQLQHSNRGNLPRLPKKANSTAKPSRVRRCLGVVLGRQGAPTRLVMANWRRQMEPYRSGPASRST